MLEIGAKAHFEWEKPDATTIGEIIEFDKPTSGPYVDMPYLVKLKFQNGVIMDMWSDMLTVVKQAI